MKKLLIPLFIIVGNLSFYAAESSYNNPHPLEFSAIPPSPDVASLLKYTEIPVSYFYGLPQINFTLYEVTEGSLKVPISINYHGGGIKMSEPDGNLGLGWTLQAGGVVGRTVNGLPDELSGRNRGLYNHQENDRQLRDLIRNKITDYDPINIVNRSDSLKRITELSVDYRDGRVDMANDIYSLNGLGLSGTFIYDDDKEVVVS